MPNNFGGDQHDPDYNPDAQKASRKQRVKRIAMKKQAQKVSKTAKTKTKPAEAAWHVRAQALPIMLFHTTIGPIIGRVEKTKGSGVGSFDIRMWAPAAIRMGFQPGQPGAFVAQYSVTFQPIALIETYLDLSTETPFGRSPVPQALIPAYEDYFERIAAGDYSFARSTAHVEQAMPHEAPIADADAPPSVEPAAEPVVESADPDAVDVGGAETTDDESPLS